MSMMDDIASIESIRQTRVLVFASSQLDIDLLPSLYEVLAGMGPCERLDVVLYSRGGIINAARRIALLLREFAPRVSFLVPHYCESAGTVMALSADEIIAGPLAIFSPIDPILMAAQGARGGPLALSAQDLRLFGEMSSQWFGLSGDEAGRRAFDALSSSIFPTTLTSFYRSTLEVEGICMELMALHMAGAETTRESIAKKLIFGFHSHTYALTRDELRAIGLPVRSGSDAGLESMMWSICRQLRSVIGGAARTSAAEPWFDAFLGTTRGACVRVRNEEFPGQWQRWEDDADGCTAPG
ncbi:MAG: hypothetical protein M3Q42_10100 [Pseudomonadota bacterium]|nr:hypothetical protein [Pseudomonadota bacterium]